MFSGNWKWRICSRQKWLPRAKKNLMKSDFHPHRLATCEHFFFFFSRYRLSTNFFYSVEPVEGRSRICSRNPKKILAGKAFFGKVSRKIFVNIAARRWVEVFSFRATWTPGSRMPRGRLMEEPFEGKFIERTVGSLSLRNWNFQEIFSISQKNYLRWLESSENASHCQAL